MSKRISLIRTLVVMFVVNILALASAMATDLTSLGQRLAPAYTAMSYERLCKMLPKWTETEPLGALGTASNYAEQAKNTVIGSFSYNQSVGVLRIAADSARAEARQQLREKVISEDKLHEEARFKAWCHGYVSEFIRKSIANYDVDNARPFSMLGR